MKAKWWQILFVILVLGSALTPLAGLILGIDSPRFASEALPPKPELVVGGKLNIDFTQDFDTYWQRAFSGNSFLVSNYNRLSQTLTRSSTNEKIIVGKEDMLFFGETLPDITGYPAISDAAMARILQVLDVEREYVESLGSSFYFTLAPNKASVYPENLPPNLSGFGHETNAERLYNNAPAYFIDLFSALDSAKAAASTSIYHDLDSHWNAKGAFAAYSAIVEAVGLQAATTEVPTIPVLDFQGDLATMYYPDRRVLDLDYEHETFEPNFTPLRPIRTMDDIRLETISPDQAGSLLMYRDSFANALIPYFSSSFSETSYLRGETQDLREVEKGLPDVVLLELAERNLNWLLQKTPIMEAPSTEAPENVRVYPLDATLNLQQTERYEMWHYNLRLPDELVFDDCLVYSDGRYYRAFAVYEDSEIEDGLYGNGLSLYMSEPLTDPVFFLHGETGWMELSSE